MCSWWISRSCSRFRFLGNSGFPASGTPMPLQAPGVRDALIRGSEPHGLTASKAWLLYGTWSSGRGLRHRCTRGDDNSWPGGKLLLPLMFPLPLLTLRCRYSFPLFAGCLDAWQVTGERHSTSYGLCSAVSHGFGRRRRRGVWSLTHSLVAGGLVVGVPQLVRSGFAMQGECLG